MENAKIFAELVDKKLARHYELDDSGPKKVTSLLKLLKIKQPLEVDWNFFNFLLYKLKKGEQARIQNSLKHNCYTQRLNLPLSVSRERHRLNC